MTDLPALFQQHKKELAVAGAALVGGLALMKRHQAGGDATPAAAAAGSTTSRGAVVPSGSSGQVVYDSSASDIYNSMAPLIQQLASSLDRQNTTDPDNTIPVPVAAPAPAAPRVNSGFYAIAGDPTGQGAVYQFNADTQTRDWLSGDEWHAMGSPLTGYLAINDAAWSTAKLVGGEAPNAGNWWKRNASGQFDPTL